MQIICCKRLHFQDHEIVKNTKTDENVAVLKQQTTVAPSIHPQEVPDWIRNDDLFRLSVEDGAITVVQVLSVPKLKGKSGTVAKPSGEVVKKADEPAASGWGAKPGAGLPNGNDIGGKTA
jgi:hypothetical protein